MKKRARRDSGALAAGPDASGSASALSCCPQVPYEAAGSVLPLTVIEMLKQTRAIHKLFGENSASELDNDNDNAYHHAGMEYRLDDHALLDAAAKVGHGPLVNWARDVSSRIFQHLIDKVSGIEHLDQATGIARYHDFQAVLCQLDTGSARRTRGVQGPLGIKDNVPNPQKDSRGAASS